MAKPAPPPKPPASRRETRGEREVTSDAFLSRLSPEQRAKLEQQAKLLAEVRDFAKKHPEEAGKLLRV
ncbi:MAG: hypothetical protein V3U35_07110, partial [Candidatus Neomarinimicrobiota bacterium]